MFIYVQLIFEQHGFELRRSTYTIIFFNKYIPQHRTISSWLNCWMWSLRYGGPTVSYTRIFDTQKVGTLTFRLFKGQLYTHTHTVAAVQLLSRIRLCDPVACSTPGFSVLQLSPGVCANSRPELVMLSNHLILCCPLLLLPECVYMHVDKYIHIYIYIQGSSIL